MELTPEIIQSISIVELFVATLFSIILALFTFRKYNEKKNRSTLFISLNFILQGFALTFVAIDRILLTILLDQIPGLIFHNIAIYLSLTIIFLLDLFAFDMTFPNHFKKLAIIVIVLLAISSIILVFNQPTVGLIDKEIIYSDILLFFIAPFIFPPIIIPISVFIYYSAIVRKESKPKSLRAATMGLSTIIVAISYIFELMGITGFIVIIVRLGFVIYTMLMYISFILPKWYQKIIKWEETA